MMMMMIRARYTHSVMAGLVPAIHVFLAEGMTKTWMPGTRPGMTEQVASASA
jgi:hypothetical protein